MQPVYVLRGLLMSAEGHCHGRTVDVSPIRQFAEPHLHILGEA
jgi:hypothetical protein